MKKKDNPLPSDTLHFGSLIKAELYRQGRTAVWLSKQVNCTPDNIYKAFNSQWVSMPLLFRISRALDHDFFRDCSNLLQSDKNAGKPVCALFDSILRE